MGVKTVFLATDLVVDARLRLLLLTNRVEIVTETKSVLRDIDVP
jgi:hypothetical protein